MNEALISLLERRKNKAIAVVLGVKEREVDQYLPDQAQIKLRKVVLDQFNELFELCLDVARSADGEVAFNQDYLTMIEELHTALLRDGAVGFVRS